MYLYVQDGLFVTRPELVFGNGRDRNLKNGMKWKWKELWHSSTQFKLWRSLFNKEIWELQKDEVSENVTVSAAPNQFQVCPLSPGWYLGSEDQAMQIELQGQIHH